MGGNFSRLYTRSTGGTISGPNDDAEFDNVITNFTPAGLDDYSANAAQMQSTADPYPGSVESLATTGAGELERIRYVIKQITGEAQWYIDPDTDLATHYAATAIHGATGAVVGTTNTQTLTNKTLTSPTLTTPKIVTTGYIADAGGDEYLEFVESTTPVNHVRITQGDTGVGPTISAQGETNVDLTLAAKGTGLIKLSSGILGAWDASKANDTVYQAASDLDVAVYLSCADTNRGSSAGYTDSSNPPTTIRGRQSIQYASANGVYHPYGTYTMRVKKGDYWKVVKTEDAGTITQTIYAIPIGA